MTGVVVLLGFGEPLSELLAVDSIPAPLTAFSVA